MTHSVLLVVNDLPFFLSHRLPVALGARAAGYDVHIVTPDHPQRIEVEGRGLGFHPIPLTRGRVAPVSEVRTILALTHLYRRLKPDLVHHVTHKPVLYGSLAARLARVPAVVNAISGLGYTFIAEGRWADYRRRLILATYRIAFNHPRSRGIFQNAEDAALFRLASVISPAQVVVIPGSGVDLGSFTPEPEPSETPVVLLAARMLWDKGVGDFVAASRLLKARGSRHRAVLVGEPDPGNPRSIPAYQLQAWATEGVVEWWGYRQDMARVFARCHLCCLPSYREGVPRVLLEAAAAGRPIVTTDVPGCRDVVRHGENGLVVPPAHPERLADAIETLLADPGLRARMGGYSRALATSWGRARFRRFLRQLLAEPMTPRHKSVRGRDPSGNRPAPPSPHRRLRLPRPLPHPLADRPKLPGADGGPYHRWTIAPVERRGEPLIRGHPRRA